MSQVQIIFLEVNAQSAYYQGLEDALKANPPLHPRNQEYMQGYNSLVQTLPTQWAA